MEKKNSIPLLFFLGYQRKEDQKMREQKVKIFEGGKVFKNAFALELQAFLERGGNKWEWRAEDVPKEFIDESVDEAYETALEVLSGSTEKNGVGYYVVTGSIGLRDGRHDVSPLIEESLYDAIDKCVHGGTLECVTIEIENGAIKVIVPHNEGTNVFNVFLFKEDAWIEAEDKSGGWMDEDIANYALAKGMMIHFLEL